MCQMLLLSAGWRQDSHCSHGASEGTQIISIQTTEALLLLCYSRLGCLVPLLEDLPSVFLWADVALVIGCGLDFSPLGLHRLAPESSAPPSHSPSPASSEEWPVMTTLFLNQQCSGLSSYHMNSMKKPVGFSS